jgi:hypothetical protein
MLRRGRSKKVITGTSRCARISGDDTWQTDGHSEAMIGRKGRTIEVQRPSAYATFSDIPERDIVTVNNRIGGRLIACEY